MTLSPTDMPTARPQARVEIYYSDFCPYCRMAKSLLDQKGVTYELYDTMADRSLRQEAQTRSGRRTVPQIFIDDQSIGGCDELHALERRGELDSLLYPAAE